MNEPDADEGRQAHRDLQWVKGFTWGALVGGALAFALVVLYTYCRP